MIIRIETSSLVFGALAVILVSGLLLWWYLRQQYFIRSAVAKPKNHLDNADPKSLESAVYTTEPASDQPRNSSRPPPALAKDKHVLDVTLTRNRSVSSSSLYSPRTSTSPSSDHPITFERVLPYEQNESLKESPMATQLPRSNHYNHYRSASDVIQIQPVFTPLKGGNQESSSHESLSTSSHSLAPKEFSNTPKSRRTPNKSASPLKKSFGGESPSSHQRFDSLSDMPNELDRSQIQAMACTFQKNPSEATAEGLYQLKATAKVLCILKEMEFNYAQSVLKNLKEISSKEYIFKLLKHMIRELQDYGVQDAENLQLVEAFTLLHAISRGLDS